MPPSFLEPDSISMLICRKAYRARGLQRRHTLCNFNVSKLNCLLPMLAQNYCILQIKPLWYAVYIIIHRVLLVSFPNPIFRACWKSSLGKSIGLGMLDVPNFFHEALAVIIPKYLHTRRKLSVSSIERYHFPVERSICV